MAEVELEAVLEFLRKNGLSECESALVEDVMEKSQLGSSEFEKFLFPMVPPPPPLRIPSTRQLLPPQEISDPGESSKDSSDDEFVSLGSSTTELCSSEFTNPYGIRTTRPSSRASSDRLSQFGTARDYPDFDMQNDLFWYKEKDEDYAMPPLFGARDFDGYPSEDKYVMAVQTGERMEERPASDSIPDGGSKHLEARWALTSRDNLEDKVYKDYYELDEHFRLEKGDGKHGEHCTDYSCLATLCACCNDAGRVYAGNPSVYGLENLKVIDTDGIQFGTLGDELAASDTDFFTKRNSKYDLLGGLDDIDDIDDFLTVDQDDQPSKNDNYDFIYDEVIPGEPQEPEVAENEEGGAISDELLLYKTKEDDYEVFHLRIIHRKNRTGFEENREFPIVMNSIIAGRYYVTEFLGSAAFSKVVQAHDLYLARDVCLKIIKNDKDFFDQSLDEIKLLKFVNKHDPADEWHILRLYDYFYYQEHLFIVTELLRANLYEFQKYNRESGVEPYFTLNRLQVIARQCLEALLYLHDLGIIHCDLKPENILIKSYRRCKIKIIDLGSSCFHTDNLSLYVQSRSYRAPEVILGLPYDQKIDLWSLGCILAELYSGEVLFPNEPVTMILAHMIGMLGPIDMDMLQNGQETHKYFTEDYDLFSMNEDMNEAEYIVPEESSLEHHLEISDSGFLDFLKYLLQINPERRPTATEALQHPWLSHSYEVNSF